MQKDSNVFRIGFRLRGKEHQTISLIKPGQPADASVKALAPGVEILSVEPLGAYADWSGSDYIRLVMDTQDRNEPPSAVSRAAPLMPPSGYVC